MENDVLDYLNDIGYSGVLKESATLSNALNVGIKDESLRELIVWLCQQLTELLKLDESVTAISGDEDLSGFTMEVSSLLKELNCPYENLLQGPVSERLATKELCLQLLIFLLSEVMAARMVKIDQPNSMEVRIRESDTAKDLKQILLALKFPRPPDNITTQDLFSKVEKKLEPLLASTPAGFVDKPLLTGRLSEAQWNELSLVQKELQEEYRLRREMLLKRLDVTVQSFQWSEQLKGKEDTIAQAFVDRRKTISAEPGVHVADILAARQDMAVIEKTSSAAARKNTQSAVHKVIIGRVPDRGGRPSEQEAPPPEMPSWQKERAQGGGGGQFSRGGGGGRGRGGGGGGQFSRGGGRVQGGWNQHDDRGNQQDRRGSYNQHDDRGNQQDRRGSYNQHDDRYNSQDQRRGGGRGRDYR